MDWSIDPVGHYFADRRTAWFRRHHGIDVMPKPTGARIEPSEALARLKNHCNAERFVRRGVCLLNAGQFQDAEAAFRRAQSFCGSGGSGESIAASLATCLAGQGDFVAAAGALDQSLDDHPPAERVIRVARYLWKGGRRDEALLQLRTSIARDPESAELHMQLGTLLTELGDYEEAALRFEQVLSMERDRVDAQVCLALCRGALLDPQGALVGLQRAQRARPADAEIGLLLSQAAKAVQQAGRPVSVHAIMPGPDPNFGNSLDALAEIVAKDPDFVDAFLSLSREDVDEEILAILLRTLERALERQPEHAELHFHCAQVLRRLGREPEAIQANERAVALNPRLTRALIDLGRLYLRTNRASDAVARLEEALAAGAEYADVYYLLGNLYREEGRRELARGAYERALSINGAYRDAREALASLSA